MRVACGSSGGERHERLLRRWFGRSIAVQGLQFDVMPALGLRGEWQRYRQVGGSNTGGKGDIDVLNIGALWRFRYDASITSDVKSATACCTDHTAWRDA